MNDEIQTAAAWREKISSLEERRSAAWTALAELGSLRGRVALDVELGRLPIAEVEKADVAIQSRRLELELVALIRPRRDPGVERESRQRPTP